MKTLFSIRMRAAQGGAHEQGGLHISGAERIVEARDLERVAGELIHRALHHSKGESDFINITVDALEDDKILHIPPLPVMSHDTLSVAEAHRLARTLLIDAGISAAAVDSAFFILQNISVNMRGAAVIDAISGERIDHDVDRGIRVSHMDMEQSACNKFESRNEHFREAIVLASKVQAGPGIVGELCWSDDPDYTTGYVACLHTYHRLMHMKAPGSSKGGRVFFVSPRTDVRRLTYYLESEAVLVSTESLI